jgi:hypothetical protein
MLLGIHLLYLTTVVAFKGTKGTLSRVGFILIILIAVTGYRDSGKKNLEHGSEPQPERGLCTYSTGECIRHPTLSGKMVDESEDVYIEHRVGVNERACLLRAFFNWRFCGSVPWEPLTMIYQPTGVNRSFPSAEAVEAALQKATEPLTGSGDDVQVNGLWAHEKGGSMTDVQATQSQISGMGGWKLAFVWVRDHVSDSKLHHSPQPFNGELGVDKWVMDIFRAKRNGFFIDLAADDAVLHSNTLTLERIGWEGLCIEAQSKYMPRLLHRKCKVVQAMVTQAVGENVMFNSQGVCGSGCAHVINKEVPMDDISPDNIEIHQSVTFERIIRDFRVPPVIDFLSLDIEGSEDAAMSTFPWNTHTILSAAVERPSKALISLLLYNSIHLVKHVQTQDGKSLLHT